MQVIDVRMVCPLSRGVSLVVIVADCGISFLLQLNSDLQPFMKAGAAAAELLPFSLSAAPVVFHRQLVGEERWLQQLQQVQRAATG